MKLTKKKLLVWGASAGAGLFLLPMAIGFVLTMLAAAVALSALPASILILPLAAYIGSMIWHRKDFILDRHVKLIPSIFNRMSERTELLVFSALLVVEVALVATARVDVSQLSEILSVGSQSMTAAILQVFGMGFVLNVAATTVALILGGCRPRVIVSKIKSHIAGQIDTTPEHFGDAMADRVEDIYSKSDNKLLKGDLESYSRERYPESKYPELYADMPEDVRRSIIQDGRLITGETLVALVPRRLSTKTVRDLFASLNDRFAPAMVTAFVAAALISASVVSVVGLKSDLAAAAGEAQKIELSANQVPTYVQDVWPADDAQVIADEFNKPSIFASIMDSAGGAATWAAETVSDLLLLVSVFAFLGAFGYLRNMKKALSPVGISAGIKAVLDEEVALRTETVESIVRWKRRQEVRDNDSRGYRSQISFAIKDKSPLITLGVATGTMAFRGALNGYLPGQDVCMSLNDLHQNIFVFGGTGSGKTYSVLQPLMSQAILAAIENRSTTDDGKKVTQALYVTDGKGVLWMDAVQLAKKYGIECRVIGCGPDEFGVDLFGGLDPQVVASTLNNCMSQISGSGSSDPFWMEMACQIIEASTKIARVWELTENGFKHVNRTGERIYSPVGVFSLARSIRDPNGMAFTAVQDILEQVESDPESISALLTPDLWSSVEFLRRDMINYPEQTVGSFLAHVTQILAGFTNLFELRSQFGGAGSPRTIDIDRIWDDKTITAVNLSPAEWGDAGRMINIFVKARLYHRARMRQLKDNDIGKKSKLIIVMDEAQDLVTTGSGGYSETSFLNYSRSTGCSFVMATQTPSALYAALGEGSSGQKTGNVLDQFRTKIFLAAEGQEIISYMKSLAGRAARMSVADNNQHESFFAQMKEEGLFDANLDLIEPFDLEREETYDLIVNGTKPEDIVVKNKVLFEEVIEDEIKNFMSELDEQENPLNFRRTATHRAQDKRDSVLGRGAQEEDLIHNNDLQCFARGQAYVYVQRAGNVKQDIITLHPEKYL